MTILDVLQSVGSELGSAAVGLFAGALFQRRLEESRDRRRRLKRARRIRRHQGAAHSAVRVAGLPTRVHLVEGDGQLLLEPANVTIRVDRDPVDLSPVVATARQQALAQMAPSDDQGSGVQPAWNSTDLVAVRGYRIARTGDREEPQLRLTVCPTDYATFSATVTGLDEDLVLVDDSGGSRTSTLRAEVLPDARAEEAAVDRPVPQMANGLGVAVLVFTDDDQVILSRRRPTARARPGERDVSVVEGMHLHHDRQKADTLDVAKAVIRGCEEELGIQVGPSDVHVLALAVDMTFYQWSFLGLVNAPYTAEQVLDRHALHARDRWEARLEAVPADPEEVFRRLAAEGVWDLGLVTAYLALCFHDDADAVHRAACRVFSRDPDGAPSWRPRHRRAVPST